MTRDVSQQALARRGLVALVALALIGVAVLLRSNGTFGSQPHVTAVVADAGGALRKGSDVKWDGSVVGKVAGVERHESGAVAIDIEMSPDDIGRLPANVAARILPATVFGTTYVDLVVHGPVTPDSLEAGAEIPADTTQETLEFQRALDDIDRLVSALGPAELASALGSMSQALEGRGDQLAATVSSLSSYLARVNPRLPAVREDLRALATSVAVLDEVAPDLLDATEDGLVFTGSLIRQEAALTTLVVGGARFATTSTSFLSRNQRRLVAFIRGTGGLVDVVYDNRHAGITDAISVNIRVGNALPKAVVHGFLETDTPGGLRFDLPPYYTAADRPTLRSMVEEAARP
jgi:virulence factor Mce-like protein